MEKHHSPTKVINHKQILGAHHIDRRLTASDQKHMRSDNHHFLTFEGSSFGNDNSFQTNQLQTSIASTSNHPPPKINSRIPKATVVLNPAPTPSYFKTQPRSTKAQQA